MIILIPKYVNMRTLSLVLIILSSIIIMANRSGRGAVSGNGATTAPGESGTYCGSFGCHFSGDFDPEASIRLLGTDSMQVNAYIPGEKYIIEVDADFTGNPAGFGFQMVALKSSDNSGIGGYDNLPNRVRSVNIGNREYVEHSNILEAKAIYLDWEAPSEGTGAIDLYASVNVVNGNGSTSGDGADTTKLQIIEEQVSNTFDLASRNTHVFPNPASSVVNVQSKQDISEIMLIDFSGRKLLSQTNVNNYFDVSGLDAGVYILVLSYSDGSRESSRISVKF